MDVDYAQLIKIYGQDRESDTRYSPSVCKGTAVNVVTGDPNPDLISTSYVERQNLTMRMSMRRFTRLTNAFSKKMEMHASAVAIHFMYYNFCRVHKTLRMSPAMAAGVTEHLWSVPDLVALLEASEPKPGSARAVPAEAAEDFKLDHYRPVRFLAAVPADVLGFPVRPAGVAQSGRAADL